MLASQKLRYKIVVLGEGRVGKTSILIRFAEGKFEAHDKKKTINSSFIEKKIKKGDSTIELCLWVIILSGHCRSGRFSCAKLTIL